MKTINSIPTSKLQRASNIIKTGAKVGGNYVKYYANRVTKSKEEADQILNEDNAEDIYDGLKNLKGSALKVAQMMSMDKSVLPKEYVEKFSLSQFSVPPLSGPLISKTFSKSFGKSPSEIFDSFSSDAIYAASIGQVHKASKNGEHFAVKIQYPGVANSISSDLALVKPFALKLLNISSKDADVYFQEVKNKLLEETDYHNELIQGKTLASECSKLKNIIFPKYYTEFSSDKVLTMEWMEGEHLSTFCERMAGTPEAHKISQALWDFYMFQLHVLKKFHADPHPGNFLVDKDCNLIVLDFGCLKTIPDNFYTPYFELVKEENRNNSNQFKSILKRLEVLYDDDTPEEEQFIESIFSELLSVFTKPFQSETFDFSNEEFFQEIVALGEKLSKDKELRNQNGGRGSKHFIYMNRTFFGLYNLMFDLKSKNIVTMNYSPDSNGE
ncbi:MAG: ABC transporter [Flavobacteriales bacterium]|nr:ABC transporter [Flavobacteriales bacterium]|tara:strand:- start:2647 stop:3969 length:1323 start_codon:yes stop_codon:yes gene_type:complete